MKKHVSFGKSIKKSYENTKYNIQKKIFTTFFFFIPFVY